MTMMAVQHLVVRAVDDLKQWKCWREAVLPLQEIQQRMPVDYYPRHCHCHFHYSASFGNYCWQSFYDSPPVYRSDYVVFEYPPVYRSDCVVDIASNRNAVGLRHLEKSGSAVTMMTMVLYDDHVVVVLPIPNFGSNLVGHYVTFPPHPLPLLLLLVATLLMLEE